MTETPTKWGYQQVLPAGVRDDQPVLDAFIAQATEESEESARRAGYTLTGEPTVRVMDGIMTSGQGEPGDDDYEAPMTWSAEAAALAGIEGDPILFLRMDWPIEPAE